MKIGILGGGQLGRMLIQSALKYDDEFYTLDPAADAPCHNISYFTQGNFNDYQTVLDFGKDKDVVTIEIEHVNADALETLENQGVKVVPNSRIIKIIQQKILQKEFYKENNIPSPDFQTVQNLLDFNICPTILTEDIQNQISAITDKFLAAINSPGLFAIELFLDKDGKVWVNETAPRLHNSGHQSQEGNANSQFEQMYRVVKNLPLADTDAVTFSGMLNLVGADGFSGKVVYAGLDEVLKLPKTYIHLYGKTETKPGRKMGHINVLADSREELMEKLVKIKEMVQVIAE